MSAKRQGEIAWTTSKESFRKIRSTRWEKVTLRRVRDMEAPLMVCTNMPGVGEGRLRVKT